MAAAGVGFSYVTLLLADPEALSQTITELGAWNKERRPDLILAPKREALISRRDPRTRSAAVVAARPGKLPRQTVSATYQPRYGTTRWSWTWT